MIPNSNDKILSQAILHSIYLQRYKSGAVADVLKFLNEDLWPELLSRIEKQLASPSRSRRLFALESGTQTLITAAMAEAARRASVEIAELAVSESEWQVGVFRDILPVKVETTLPSPALLRAIIERNPVQGALTKDWFTLQSESVKNAVNQRVNIGLSAGDSVNDIVTAIRGTRSLKYTDGVLNTSRRQIEAVVRTSISEVASAARDITFTENKEVIKGVQWVSTLDSRTSLICQGLDGQVFPVDSGQRPPAHWNCRSTVVPVLKSWKELGLPFSEVSESTRASLNGQVSNKITYNSWLESQSAEIQNEALGPTRAKLFRSGRMKVDRFTDDKGRSLTLRELRQKSGLSAKTRG